MKFRKTQSVSLVAGSTYMAIEKARLLHLFVAKDKELVYSDVICLFCGRESDTGIDFYPNTSAFPCQFLTTTAP